MSNCLKNLEKALRDKAKDLSDYDDSEFLRSLIYIEIADMIDEITKTHSNKEFE
jgi:hypothetical protein